MHFKTIFNRVTNFKPFVVEHTEWVEKELGMILEVTMRARENGQPACSGCGQRGSQYDTQPTPGWTDLDRTFESVLEKSKDKTQIVYVGDGLVATCVSDGVPFVRRLKQKFADMNCTLHAISTGSSYETTVLKGMGSIGAGSMRHVSGTLTPDRVAANLLSELARPAIRDLKIEFEGVRVARVYPDSLPNLSEGRLKRKIDLANCPIVPVIISRRI